MHKPKKPTGPQPERLKIKGDWEKALAMVLRKSDQEKRKPKPKK